MVAAAITFSSARHQDREFLRAFGKFTVVYNVSNFDLSAF
jgi:hypothetical protein